MKKKLIILIGIALVLIGIIGGSSFAYFTITDNNGNENVITSGTMALNLTDGQQITVNNLAPGQYLEKEFSVTNTGNVNASYDIYLSEVVNEFADKTDLVYELISLDGGYNTQNQIQVPDVSTKIINQQIILPSATHHYKLKITFLNKQENQNDNMNKFFMAKIQMNTYENINTTVKYYLDNVEVANLPAQATSNYVSSSCNNNVNITFNTTTWTYQISNLNQNNTTCNIYFERSTVTVTYNAGVGSVNPTSEDVTIGGTLTLPTPTVPSGYSFVGWYTGANGTGTKVDNTTVWTSSQTIYAYYVLTVRNYEFDPDGDGKGQEQTFTVPFDGTYKLEVWGAQGGIAQSTVIGGYGGYSVGTTSLIDGDVLYINVGGVGTEGNTSGPGTGGYNGGGNGTFDPAEYSHQTGAGGGGATHIALDSGILSSLSSHATDGRILIVAGGGGGAGYCPPSGSNPAYTGPAGHAGGYVGKNGQETYSVTGFIGHGGTQSAGGAGGTQGDGGTFGQGGNYSTFAGPGGGGGYYGGGSAGRGHAGAGGGSGYIGSSNLVSSNGITKKMVCYNCTTSNDANTKTESNTCVNSDPTVDCSKQGNGYARITLVSAN